MTQQGNKLTAAEGKVLTNGRDYATAVYLGCNGSASDWHEVDASEAPEFEPHNTPEQ